MAKPLGPIVSRCRRRLVAALCCLGVLAPACAAEPPAPLWLSETAPKRLGAAGGPGQAAETTADGEDGVGVGGRVKRLWLRQGDDPAGAAYLGTGGPADAIQLVDARGSRAQVPLETVDGRAQARCVLPELGFRNAYLTRASVRDGVLRLQLAKAELLRGTCCAKLGDVDPKRLQAIADPGQPLEIVREHAPDERLFTRIVSGDRVVFTVYRQGRPLAGARVVMLTQQGWQKRLVSDAAGQVAFTVIRDYFPAWHDFRRRHRESFLVVAETEEPGTGVRAGQAYARVAYQATLSGTYAPSPDDYKSYAWGLGLVLGVSAFAGLGIYLYRRRRLKPFKEVRFDEGV